MRVHPRVRRRPVIALDWKSELTYGPTGEIKEVGGVRSYVATPKGDYAKDKVLLFLPDVFGIDLDNGRVRL